MVQRFFDRRIKTFVFASKPHRVSIFAFSDYTKGESRHHVHANETELIYVTKGVARFTIDSSLYVAHADDIVVIERGRLHAMASDVNDPATKFTGSLYGVQFQGAEENQLLQPLACPVIAAGPGKEVFKT
ncbi:cupin domain-containing protein [Escherichia coli]|nr:cupin domain-containing protein [Escherichia coli]